MLRKATIAILVCLFLMGVVSCSKAKSPLLGSLIAVKAGVSAVNPVTELTQEEKEILKLPLAEREQVLKDKLREMLIELYGRVPDKAASAVNKQVSDQDSSGHKVEPAEGGHVINELLGFDETTDSAVWTLSFSNRLEGDLNFDDEVGVSDITPLAAHLGHRFPDNPMDPNHDVPIDEDEQFIDFEIDRASSNDYDATSLGVIGIADITPIAMNYGLKLDEQDGYHIYLEDKNSHQQVLLNLPATFPVTVSPPHRRKREYLITKTFLEDNHEILIAQTPNDTGEKVLETGDLIVIKPVFAGIEGGADTWSEPIPIQVTPTLVPVAVLSILPNPPVGGEQQIFTFDGNGSFHQNQSVQILTYQFDYNGDGKVDDEGPQRLRTHVYGKSGDYTPKLRVIDEFGLYSSWSTAINVTVYGPPAIDEFSYKVIDGSIELQPPFAEPLELPVNVRFTAKAHELAPDPNVLLQWVKFDYDGDSYWNQEVEVNLHEADLEVPSTYWAIPSSILGSAHSGTIDSKLYVSDTSTPTLNAEKTLSNTASGEIPIIHAVPHLVKSEPIGEQCFFESGRVRFDVSQSYDKDGPNGLPVKYEFDFDGDGTPDETQEYSAYYNEEGIKIRDGYGFANYPDGHTYAEVGLFTAKIRAYDEDYLTCVEPDMHVAEELVTVKVFGCDDPTIKDPVTVDDGYLSLPGVSWGNMGDPCIAVDINPWTRQPGIAYTGMIASREEIECCALFIECKDDGIWPGSPVLVEQGTTATQTIGYQLDLEYDPILFGWDKDAEGKPVKYVTKYIVSTYGGKVPNGTNGIYHFRTKSYSLDDVLWEKAVLVKSNIDNPAVNIQHLEQIRFVVSYNEGNPYSQFVHYSGSYEDEYGIWEVRGDGSLIIVEEMTQPPYAHDFKARCDDGVSSGESSVVYLHGPTPYDVWAEKSYSVDWEESPDEGVASLFPAKCFIDQSKPRSLAMDYFGVDTVGILWIAEEEIDELYEDLLVFKETAGSEERVSPHYYDGTLYAGSCDFDYEPNTGIGCAVYELQNGTNRTIKLKLRDPLTKLWIELPSAIANYTSTTRSNVDMVLDNGYIYIAYSAPDNRAYSAIQLVVVDLLNRP